MDLPTSESAIKLKPDDKQAIVGLDAEGNFYESVDDIDDESIQEYRMLQYNNVFDKNRDVELFYPKSTNDKKADASTD